jgi:hypothetical protein
VELNHESNSTPDGANVPLFPKHCATFTRPLPVRVAFNGEHVACGIRLANSKTNVGELENNDVTGENVATVRLFGVGAFVLL